MEKELDINSAKWGVSNTALKIIAIVAMTIDHIAIVIFEKLFPATTPITIAIWQIMRAIGRVTIVIMCYMTAEGFFYTRNIKKYLLRLLIFAVISHASYAFFQSGHWFFAENNVFQTSVIWPIFLGVLNLYIWTNKDIKLYLRILCFAIILVLSLPSDWNVVAVLWIFFFYVFRKNNLLNILAFLIVGLFACVLPIAVTFIPPDIPVISALSSSDVWYEKIYMVGVLLSTPILFVYNGNLGKKKLKWLFYIYYPAHLVLLGLITFFIQHLV